MLFHVTYQTTQSHRDEAQRRFAETGGQPPEGVRMVGRWHSAGGLKGFTIAETDDAESLARWTHQWTDLLTFEVTPVIDDEQFGRTLR